jgi:hypothetical protein
MSLSLAIESESCHAVLRQQQSPEAMTLGTARPLLSDIHAEAQPLKVTGAAQVCFPDLRPCLVFSEGASHSTTLG